jgi:hypothetical protein
MLRINQHSKGQRKGKAWNLFLPFTIRQQDMIVASFLILPLIFSTVIFSHPSWRMAFISTTVVPLFNVQPHYICHFKIFQIHSTFGEITLHHVELI